MSDDEWDFDSDENEETESSASQEFFKPPQLLVGIDTDPSMFTKTEEGLHGFHSCLFGLYTMLDQLLLKFDQKTIAVILAHDSHSKAMIFDFGTPVSEKLTILKKMLDMEDEAIRDEYMRTSTFDFASFLLFAKKQFQKSSAETRTRTFLYITNDSNPVGNDAKLKFRALNEAQNFPELKIKFELVTMSERFVWSEFYEEMFQAMNFSLYKEICKDEDGVVEKILPIIEPKMHHRSTRFYPAVGNEDLFMKVHIDPMVRSAKVTFKYLTRDKHAELRPRPKKKPIETERTFRVSKAKQKNQKDFKVTVKTEEIAALKSSQYPIGYALLGVMNKQLTRPECSLRKSDLMVPNPKETCNYFNVFWKYCAEKKKVLFCSYRHSRRCQTTFCEMIPKAYNNKRCFLIRYFYFSEDHPISPFDEDLEEEEEEDTNEPDEATLSNIRKLVDGLAFSYDQMAFVDVQDAREEAYIKAQILDQPLEHVENYLDNRDKINKIVDDLGVVQKRKIEEKEEKEGTSGRKSKNTAGSRKLKATKEW